ncbi:MAG: ATP-binding protein [Nitrospirota bacterium]
MKDSAIFERIIGGIDEEILLISRNHEILWANQKSIDTYGPEIIGKRCYYVTHGLDFPCQGPFDICPIYEVLTTEKPSSITHLHLSTHGNGNQRHVLIHLYPIRDGDGEITQFVHIASDVTESVVQRQMEENMWQEIIQAIDRIYAELVEHHIKLEKSRAELEERTAELERSTLELRRTQEQLIRSEKLAAIGELATGVAHELRNPLGVITNSTYYLREKLSKSGLLAEDSSISEFLDIIENEIGLSDKIIGELLNFSVITKPVVKPSDVNRIIEYAITINKTPENIEVELDLKPNLKKALVDPHQIRQAFNNLILNAYQAMDGGGRLRITTKEEEGFVKVEFKDTGCGIKEEDQKKIFDPLFTTKPAKGFGLGLAVTQGIIERHEGQIELKSKVGKGSTFVIKLPIAKEGAV